MFFLVIFIAKPCLHVTSIVKPRSYYVGLIALTCTLSATVELWPLTTDLVLWASYSRHTTEQTITAKFNYFFVNDNYVNLDMA